MINEQKYKDKTGLERQKGYLEYTGTLGDAGNSFFKIDKVVESMRDSGYRDIRKAINDIIDNSIQAEASKIAVLTTSSREEKKGAREKVNNIAIVDNGYGMYPEMIRAAVSWGGTDRHNVRDGLGRFGFGLPTAAVSVTREYEVYSKVKGEEWYMVKVDLDEIAEKSITGDTDSSVVPNFNSNEPPKFVKEYLKKHWGTEDLDEGTIVLLKEPDRIRSFSLPSKFAAKMLQNIGLTYRHFFKRHSFYVNESKVKLVDPLFLNPNGVGYDVGNGHLAEGMDDLVFEVKNYNNLGELVQGKVKLRFSLMHPRFQNEKSSNSRVKSRLEVMKENNGYLIVCRSGRQIDIVTRSNYQSDSDNTTIINYDRNWAIELDFEPALDELFGVTTNKQQVEFDDRLWDALKQNDLPSIVSSLRKRLKDMREDVNNEKAEEDSKEIPKISETVMTDAEKFDQLTLPEEKKNKAENKLKQEAKERSQESGKPEEETLKEVKEEASERKYKIEYTALPGAPFYDVELWGPQTKIKINKRHRFFTDVYSQLDLRAKGGIELLLFVLGKSELEATDDKEDFYMLERYEWSKKLELRLKMLDKNEPLLDRDSARQEEEEQTNSQ